MQLALELDRDRIVALQASVLRDRVVVESCASGRRPERVDPSDASSVGAWIDEFLAGSGLSQGRGGLTLAVHRGEVVLKHLALPRASSLGGDDLASIVRLQMSRQVPVSMEGTVVDYVELVAGEVPASSDDEPRSDARHVLAGALPGARMHWIRSVSDSAKLKIGRIGLRSSGGAALLAETSRGIGGPVMGVAPGWSSTEFLVVDEGGLVFARAVDLPLPEEGDVGQYAERAAVEAKRTWMAYRATPESAEILAITALADGELGEAIGNACADRLEMAYEPAHLPDVVEFAPGLNERQRSVVMPLAGLLGESILTDTTFDFQHPRQPPDVGAVRRQRALAAVLGVVLVFGTLGVLGYVDLANARDELAKLTRDRKKLDTQYAELLVEAARIEHMERWTRQETDWIGHLRWLSEAMPDPRDARLSGFSGVLESEVAYEPTQRRGSLAGGKWESLAETRLTIGGPVRGRGVADALRNRLVASNVYRVTTNGPDVADSFGFSLTTTAPSPVAAESAEDEKVGGDAEQERRTASTGGAP
jgi:hypothetical protein